MRSICGSIPPQWWDILGLPQCQEGGRRLALVVWWSGVVKWRLKGSLRPSCIGLKMTSSQSSQVVRAKLWICFNCQPCCSFSTSESAWPNLFPPVLQDEYGCRKRHAKSPCSFLEHQAMNARRDSEQAASRCTTPNRPFLPLSNSPLFVLPIHIL
jgi:hypothetical protein